jgi:hypothetical protein
MSRIRVTIDELKLNGLDARERAALVEALQSELRSALAGPGSRTERTGSRQIPVLRLPRVALEPGTSAAGRLASAVAKAIGKEVRG